jgi:hypothetical protein
MKYKLKDIDFTNGIEYKLNSGIGVKLNGNNLVNFTYNSELLEFQTPKVLIEKVIKENNKEYLVLKIIGTEACKTFCSKMLSLEKIHYTNVKPFFNKNIPSSFKSIFNEQTFTVKVPFRNENPQIKIYDHSHPFNYYHLTPGMEIICVVTCNNIWINFDNTASYNLTVKEILVTKEKSM